tara:strand:+ start:80 stop:214 length:135 start_codon:yes stop_codon:yes gene_type:complete
MYALLAKFQRLIALLYTSEVTENSINKEEFRAGLALIDLNIKLV